MYFNINPINTALLFVRLQTHSYSFFSHKSNRMLSFRTFTCKKKKSISFVCLRVFTFSTCIFRLLASWKRSGWRPVNGCIKDLGENFYDCNIVINLKIVNCTVHSRGCSFVFEGGYKYVFVFDLSLECENMYSSQSLSSLWAMIKIIAKL